MTTAELAEVVDVLRRQFAVSASELAAGSVTRTVTPGHSLGVSAYGNEIELWAPSDMTSVEIAAYVADELQGLVLDDLWGEPRPVCPGHAHPPSAKVQDGAAWWICPATGRRTDLIWPPPT